MLANECGCLQIRSGDSGLSCGSDAALKTIPQVGPPQRNPVYAAEGSLLRLARCVSNRSARQCIIVAACRACRWRDARNAFDAAAERTPPVPRIAAGGGRGGELTMQQHVSADTYMRFAGDCLRKARAERDPNRRRLFIVIAASWAKLADREMAKPSQRIH